MNQIIEVCVLVVMATAVVDAECVLSRASKSTKERKFLKRINRDKRNFTEYHVTYRNFSNDLPAFNKTNTDRFQPWRWFNVHADAIDELKMVYDSNLFLFRDFFDIQKVYIETVVEPFECLHTLDAEQLENLTRNFLLNDKELMNPMICSAHIYNNDGTGAIEMRCCELTTTGELLCTITNEENTLLTYHKWAVFGTVVMVVVLFFLWKLIDLGSEDFYFYPEDMKVQVQGRNETEIAHRTVKISNRIKGLEELKKTLQASTHGKKYKVHKIKLSVNKRKCIGNGKLCISFLRCIKEPLNDVTNCYCESSKKNRDCCCKPCCYSRCINVNAGAVFMILILLSCAVPLVPLIVHLHSTNSENICIEYRLKGLDCPFYLKNLPLPLIYTNLGISCTHFIIFLVYYFSSKKIFFASLTEVKDTRFQNKNKCKKTFISGFSFVFIGNFFLTLSYWIYFVLYSFIRVFVTCLGTKNKYDELVLAVLPVLFIFAEKINNVTEQYESIVEVVLNFISKQNNQSTQEHSAIIFSPNSNDNSPTDVNFFKCCRELLLVINRPLVFNRSRDEKLLSKRFISQMYSKTSDCMACELNHYAKALLFALIPCFAFLVIFFLFLNFGTLYSYSTEFTGYMAITVTFLTLFKNIPGKVKGAYMVSGISKKWFKREIKDRLLNYGESWTVSDIELIPSPDKRKEIEKIEEVEKIEEIEKIEKIEKIEEIEKIEKIEKIEEIEKIEKIEEIEKNEKIEKIEEIEKNEKIEKIEKIDFFFINKSGPDQSQV